MKRGMTRMLVAGAIATAGCAMAVADGYDDARQLISEGDYIAARQLLEAELAGSPKSARLGLIHQALGECDFEEGDLASAKENFTKSKGRNVNDANLYLGRIAFMDYDFDEAQRLYALYRKGKKKGSADNPYADMFETQLTDARNFLGRVEKLTVIDSIAVDATDFFKAVRIPASAGRLRTPDAIPFADQRDGADMVFLNENEDFMMWAAPDSIGDLRIMESIRLADGEWHEPVAAPDFLSENGDCNYPFMMSDGTTLYFASDGDGSIGGLDIFVATRDARTGEYLQPSNIGMPYNSPFDDYLLAIDEENGVGWLATDRNQLDGQVTLYVYLLNDTRENYDPDLDDITGYARISDYQSTWDPEEDYAPLLSTIRNIDTDAVRKHVDFHFPLKGGKEYTELSDFPTQGSRDAMKKYLDAQRDLASLQEDLRGLRMQYHDRRSASVKERIAKLEEIVASKRTSLRKLRSDVYKTLRR